jgi:hypothetical protein
VSQAYISVELRRQVGGDFHQRCAYCHSPENLLNNFYHIDHIVPEGAGGETHRDNLCYACPLCNTYKGSQQRGRDPQTGRFTPLFHPRKQAWERHFTWSEDRKYIKGRTRCGRATIVAYRLNDPRLVRMRTFWMRLGALPPDWEDAP